MTKSDFLPVAEPDLSGNEKKYLNDCLESSWISSKGKYIDLLEKKFSRYIGTEYAVSSSNGTTALHLALLALGIGPGDEVIVPDLTFIASANAVTFTGAKAVLVDSQKKTWNMDPAEVEKSITSRTKAIMAVHLYGHPADMERIMKIAARHKLKVIEDAAEAHGAEAKIKDQRSKIKESVWRKVGSIGKLGCFSFYGNKIITTGEGGMITTDDAILAGKMRILRDHGQNPDRRYFHEVVGFNYRMTNLQAAVGVAQLERIKDFIRRKREIAGYYNQQFSKLPGIILPPEETGARNVYWMYSVLIDKPFSRTRDEMMEILKKNNIESRPFFHPVHTMPPYFEKKSYPVSEYLSTHGINLPSGVNLSEGDINRIANVFRRNA